MALVIFNPPCVAGDDSVASFIWNLKIIQDSYDLKISMVFPFEIGINNVIAGLKDLKLLSDISETIVDGSISPIKDDGYLQTLTLKNLGIKTKLISKCQEKRESTSHLWQRHCDLLTDRAAGKMAMIWKFDEVICKQQSNLANINCQFTIKGQAKDLKIIGVTLATAAEIALKGKYEALINFSSIWYYLQQGSLSFTQSQAVYKRTKLKENLDKMFSNGKTKLKTDDFFIFESHDTFTLKTI